MFEHIDNKIQLMIYMSKCTNHLHYLPTSITIGSAEILFKQSDENLGLTLGRHLTMNEHFSTIAQTCYFKLYLFAYICRFKINSATSTLVSAFVLSRIGYYNSLLFGSTHDMTSHLQLTEKYAARVILCIQKSANIAMHFKSHH